MREWEKERERDSGGRERKRDRDRDRDRDGAIPVAWRAGGWPNANPNPSAVFDQWSGWVIDQWSKGCLISGQRCVFDQWSKGFDQWSNGDFISDPECQYVYIYLSIYVHISTDVYSRICVIYTYIYCRYTSEYVSYTVLRYMIRTLLYMYVYVRICLPGSSIIVSILPWLLQCMHVFQVYTCI